MGGIIAGVSFACFSLRVCGMRVWVHCWGVWWFVGWALLGGVSFVGGGACAGVCLGPGQVSVVGLPCGGGY